MDQRKPLVILFWIVILAIQAWVGGVDNVWAEDAEALTERETQQLKTLNLSKILAEHPPSEAGLEDIDNYQRGLELYLQGDYPQAVSKLAKIKYSTPNSPLYIKSQFIMGDSYKKMEDWDKAVEIYENLGVEGLLLTDYSLFYLAETYKLKGENSQSIAIYKQIIEDFPQSPIIPEANYQIAQNYSALKDINSALVYYRNVLESSLDTQLKAQVLLELSDLYWQEKKYIEALNCLYEILDKGYRLKRNSEAEEWLVRRFYEMQEDLRGIEVPYPIRVKCADVLFKYGYYDRAEDLYREIITAFPKALDIAEVYYKRARTLYYKREYREAINLVEKIIAKFPLEEEVTIKATYLEGNSLRALGERYLAMDKYEKIIGQYPASYYARQSYLQLAETYFQLKETEKGISKWEELIIKYPDSEEAMTSWWNLARYYTNNGVDLKALDYYRELSERFSQSRLADEALYWRGKTLAQLGLEEEAKIIYEKLVQGYPLSYYAERAREETEEISLVWPVSAPQEEDFVDLEEFFKKYDNLEERAQLSLLKAELFEEIGFYRESIIELREALNHSAGNIFLWFKLSTVFQKNGDYYDSLNYTEVLFDYLMRDNRELANLPRELWQNFYPVYFEDTVREYAGKYEIHHLLVLAIIREESRFNPSSESVARAKGLMQIIPSTGEWLAQKINLEDFTEELLFSPEVNINLGCWYISYLEERFAGDPTLIISSYNAGQGTVSNWIEQYKYNRSDLDNFVENIPYEETREYVKKVMKSYQMYKKLASI